MVYAKAFKPELITRKNYFTYASYKGVQNWVFLHFMKSDSSVTFKNSKETLGKIPWQRMASASSCAVSLLGSCEFYLPG